MKTEALIELLIETSKPDPRPSTRNRSSSFRIVSSRPGSSSGIRQRVGSMIIHDVPDTQDEPMDEDLPERQNPVPDPVARNGAATHPVRQPVTNAPGPATRTRNAVESHRRIGLGRPKALQVPRMRPGVRNVSSGIPKRTRGGSKSIPPSQLPIREVSEEQMPQAGPSGTKHDAPTARSSPLTDIPSRSSAENIFKSHEPSAVLSHSSQAQIAEMQAELKRLTSKASDIDTLRDMVEDLKIEVAALRSQSMTSTLEAQVRALQEEIASLRVAAATDSSGTRTLSSDYLVVPTTSSSIPGPSDENETLSALGKRNRTLEDDDNIVGVIEAGEEVGMSAEVCQTHVIRPARKRGKLAEKEPSPGALARWDSTDDVDQMDEAEVPPPILQVPRGPAFTVFSGPEEPPEPPETNSQSGSQTRTPSTGATPIIATSTANGAENQAPSTGNNAFTFNFATSIFQRPATPTPAAGGPMPALAAPTSPTPAYVERNGRRERNDPFHPLGPPRRPPSQVSRTAAAPPTTSSNAQRTGEATVSPAAFTHTPPLPSLHEEPRSTAEGQTTTITNHPPPPPPPAVATAASTHLRAPLAGSSNSTLPPSSSGAPPPPAAPTATTVQAAPAGPARTGSSAIPGLALVPLPSAPETPAPPVRRTMYGTERDMDTRFGDFGLEGVASLSFWSAAPGGF
ncbi:uncharacterized protein PHACADRAFT_190070 [Phanerochaete carnosa HHB-10118-sp]|uniref:Uncharacterized protein n=1 Tax=Phanerochaete carnosa (strain HHB-10118-sp) TaxID=650164 RepID=K5WNC6_PHACS|nr:uncharacterized protein PHACADRAFT_190070 [Phanerochaete carnosa HHB-10118-sp]EKM60940.1 hypothetical protein PHACADRAFT_190070 [Phanerochaete carnosa HHB-10118-sp]